MIAVESGVPLPPKKSGRPGVYPFATMKVGDSFAIPVAPGKDPSTLTKSMVNTASAWARRHDSAVRFSVRLREEEGKQVVRVWAVQR